MRTRRFAVGSVALLAASLSLAQTPSADMKQISSKEHSDLRPLTAEKLVGTPQLRGVTWSPDGKQVALVSDLGGTDEIWLLPVSGGWPRQLTALGQRIANPVWSPDGRWIAVETLTESATTDLVMVNAATGSASQLTSTPEVSERSLRWSPDARQVAFVADSGDGGADTVVQNVLTRSRRNTSDESWLKRSDMSGGVLARSRNGKIEASISESPNQLVLTDAEDRDTDIIAQGGFQRLAMPEAFSPDGRQLLWYREAADAPRELWLLEVNSQEERQLSNAAIGGVRAGDLVRPVVERLTNGTRTAAVYAPYNQYEKAKTPAIVYMTGAVLEPERFDGAIQYLVNQGYLVIALGADSTLEDAATAANRAKDIAFVDPLKTVLMANAALIAEAGRSSGSQWAAVVALGTAASPAISVQGLKSPLLVVTTGARDKAVAGKTEAAIEVRAYRGPGNPLDTARQQRVEAVNAIGEFLKKYVPAPGCGCSLE